MSRVNVVELVDRSWLSPVQILVLVLCGLCMVMDGFDVQAMAVEICADALVCRAISTMDSVTRAELSNQIQRVIRSTRRIPPALCRDTIAAMLATCPEGDFIRRFRLRFEWADEAISRLDAMEPPFHLTEQDYDILFL